MRARTDTDTHTHRLSLSLSLSLSQHTRACVCMRESMYLCINGRTRADVSVCVRVYLRVCVPLPMSAHFDTNIYVYVNHYPTRVPCVANKIITDADRRPVPQLQDPNTTVKATPVIAAHTPWIGHHVKPETKRGASHCSQPQDRPQPP